MLALTRSSTAVLATAALSALLAAAPLKAQQEPAAVEEEADEPLDQYRVELIVFEYGDALAGSTEDWSAPAEDEADGDGDGETADGEAAEEEAARVEATGEGAGAASAGQSPAAPRDGDATDDTGAEGETDQPVFRFVPLPEDELELVEVYRRLAGTAGYEPLLHVAWQQPGYEPADARALDLARVGELPDRLRGEARLYRSRFLHLGLELELSSARSERLPQQPQTPRPLTPSDSAAGEPLQALEPDVYRLSERRKLRSGELHYYDHPRYGVLAKVTPVEPEETPAESTEPGDGAPAETGTPAG